MAQFRRVISPKEVEIIRASNTIPTNFEACSPYSAGSVVFLFPIEAASPDYLKPLVVKAREEHGKAFYLTFEADFQVEPDRSGWPSAVVHIGPIAMDRLAGITIEEVPDYWPLS